jgi:hypothetical protein
VAVADHRPDRWAADLPVTQLRFARPTSRLDAVVHFYRDCLALDELSRFEDHAGDDGVMLGLPDASCHLEVTQRTGTDGTATTNKSLRALDLRIASALAWSWRASRTAGTSPSKRSARSGPHTTR